MELVRLGDAFDPATWVLPLEYVFRRPDGDHWTLCFVPTVPVDESDGDELHGDLFTCPFEAIVPGTRPVPRGGPASRPSSTP